MKLCIIGHGLKKMFITFRHDETVEVDVYLGLQRS